MNELRMDPTNRAITNGDHNGMKAKKSEFARKLRDAMLNRGWNQSELARRAGLGRDNISGYIRARNLPNDTHLKKIADALAMKPDELIEGVMGVELTEQDVLEIKATHNGNVRLRISQEVSLEMAMEIMKILQKRP